MKKLLLIPVLALLSFTLMAQDCSNLFISEYIEGSGNNKAIELYNPTNSPVNLSSYVLVRYRNGLFTPDKVSLSGTIQPYGTFVAVLDKRDPGGTGQEIMVDPALQAKADTFLCPVYDVNKMMYFNGNDAVTLEKVTGEIIDIFARIGPPMLEDDEGWGNITDTTITYNSGGVPTQYTIQDYIVGPLFWLSWTSNHTLIRKPGVKRGVTENPAVFKVDDEWDSIPQNTFDSLRYHRCECNLIGVDENPFMPVVSIYPNPVTGSKLNIESERPFTEIRIYDLAGRIVQTEAVISRENEFSCLLDESLKGIYFIRVLLEDGLSYTSKLIIR